MATIKLGKRPKEFTRKVEFIDIDGTKVVIPGVRYIYRTKKEFGKWLDGLAAQIMADHPAPPADGAPAEAAVPPADLVKDAEAITRGLMTQIMESGIDSSANYIMGCVEGWGLDIPFNVENVKAICDEYPGGAAAIMEMYRAASADGRTGN